MNKILIEEYIRAGIFIVYFICFAMYMNTIITINWENKTENTNVTKKNEWQDDHNSVTANYCGPVTEGHFEYIVLKPFFNKPTTSCCEASW